MLVNRAYYFELDPNNKQETNLYKHAGAARFSSNWALADRIDRYKNNIGKERYISFYDQDKYFNSQKNIHLLTK